MSTSANARLSAPPRRSVSSGPWLVLLPLVFLGSVVTIQLWFTSPLLAAGLWPADIHEIVLLWLGGTLEPSLTGDADYRLPFVSVLLRMALVLTLGLLPAVVRHRAVLPLLRPLTWSLLIPCVWWMIWLVGDLGVEFAAQLAAGAAPLFLTGTAAVLVWLCVDRFLFKAEPSIAVGAADTESAAPRRGGPEPASVRHGWPLWTLVIAAVAWTGVSFWMNARLYAELFIPHGDSAMYEEHLWNVWHGKGFRSYLDQGLFLGEHIQVIHLGLLPLHMIWPSHLLLELAESVALASCSLPIYLGIRRRTGSAMAGLSIGLAWLFYFPMHFLDIAIDQKTFRPLALGLPFLFWLVECTERKKYRWATVCLLLALSAKEDVALISGPLLMVLGTLAWKKEKRWSREVAMPLLMGVGSLVYLVLAVLVVIPWFRSGEVVHYSRYFGDLGNSPGELVKTAISDPLRVVRQAATAQTVLYVLIFCGPLALLPLKRWLPLSAGVLTFGMLALLQFGDSSGLPPVPYHHFHAPLLVVIFWALACAVTDPQPPKSFRSANSARLGLLVFLLCAGTGLTGSLMPWGVSFWSSQTGFGYARLFAPQDEEQRNRAAMADRIEKLIPMDARVAATDFIHTRLTHRERSYDYSEYLRKVNNYQPGVPPDTDYIVIDRRHRYSIYREPSDVPEIARTDEWELLPDDTNGAYFVLRRR
ncbi:MAG: DUF2079 domain-containing protein [Planctomycetaceae bacterium]|nr:DUF2079 domain-containing protein [Planctomycetaceae bacterium]